MQDSLHEGAGVQIESDDEVTLDSETLEAVKDESLLEDREPLFNESESFHLAPPIHPSKPATPCLTETYVFTEDERPPFNDHGIDYANTDSSSPNSASLNQADMQTLQFLLHGSQDSISEPDYVESIVVPHIPPPPEFSIVEGGNSAQQQTRNRVERVNDQIASNEKLLDFTNTDQSRGSSLSVRDDGVMSPEDKCCSTQETVVTSSTASLDVSFCANPHEKLSFDEVLKSLDHYAFTTGKTARTQGKEKRRQHRSPSIPRKEKRKKDRKRSMTVASIDTSTIIAAKEAIKVPTSLTPEPPERRNSKVQQLAREYSKRIKDIQKGGLFKRFSSVREEPPELAEKPYWLRELHKRRSQEDSTENEVNVTQLPNEQNGAGCPEHVENHNMVCDTQKARSLGGYYAPKDSPTLQRTQSDAANLSPDLTTAIDPVELAGKGRLKGWVKSIVAKYGTK